MATDEARLAELLKEITPLPWAVEREEKPYNALGRETFPSHADHAPQFKTTIATGWDHPQVHGPVPIFCVASSPFFEGGTHFPYMRPEDAEYIALAANLAPALLAERDALLAQSAALRDQLARAEAVVEAVRQYSFYRSFIGIESEAAGEAERWYRAMVERAALAARTPTPGAAGEVG